MDALDRVGAVLVETYRIERLVGEGGMGSVYEATHVRLPKRFAVKFLNVPMLDNQEALARFRREAEIVAALDHPSIVSLFDYNVTETGVPYIVLEFLDGEHLGKLLERVGKLDLGAAMRILVPVASALHYAHLRQIVHRDLKPENIIITRGGQVKVVDFGIARMGGRQALTAHNTVLGTAPYMAPEQMTGQELDGRADEFALAAIAYEMLSGKMAFGADSVQATAARIVFHNPPPIEGLTEPVNFAMGKALAKKPAERFSTVEAFSQAMVEAASQKGPEVPRTPAPVVRRATLRPDWDLKDPSREFPSALLDKKESSKEIKKEPKKEAAPVEPAKKHDTSPTKLRSLGDEDSARVVDDLGEVGPPLAGDATTITQAAVVKAGPEEETPEPIPPSPPRSKTMPETHAPMLPGVSTPTEVAAAPAKPVSLPSVPAVKPIVPVPPPGKSLAVSPARPISLSSVPAVKPPSVIVPPAAKPAPPLVATPVVKPAAPVVATPVAKPSPVAERSATLPNITYRDRAKTVPDVHPAATLADLATLDAAQRESAKAKSAAESKPADAPPSPGRKEWPTEKTPPLAIEPPPDAASAAMALLRKTTEFVNESNDLPLPARKTVPLPDDVRVEAAKPLEMRATMPPEKVQVPELKPAHQWPTMQNDKVKVDESSGSLNVMVDDVESVTEPSVAAAGGQVAPVPLTSQVVPLTVRKRPAPVEERPEGSGRALRLVLIIAIALASAGTALVFILSR
jgi:serine/threonine-protein kinase